MMFEVDAGTSVGSADGFTACGDAACVLVGGEVALYAVIDALGHGPDAQQSANRVASVLEGSVEQSLPELFATCDQSLRGMRGVVMSLTRVDPKGVHFAGIGNVDLLGPRGVPRPPSTPGIVGRLTRRVRQHTLQVEAGHRWLMFSDGIRKRDVSLAVESASTLDPQRAAEHILSKARRADDDASVLVMDFRSKAR